MSSVENIRKVPGISIESKTTFPSKHQSFTYSHLENWGDLEFFSIFETLLSNSFPLTRAGPPVVIPVGPRAPHAGTLNNIRHHWIYIQKREKVCSSLSYLRVGEIEFCGEVCLQPRSKVVSGFQWEVITLVGIINDMNNIMLIIKHRAIISHPGQLSPGQLERRWVFNE